MAFKLNLVSKSDKMSEGDIMMTSNLLNKQYSQIYEPSGMMNSI